VIPYASRTGTRRNLEQLRRFGWRLLVSAKGVHRTEGFGYAIDNGAWTAHQRGEQFDADAFVAVLDKLGAGADWIVVPDIVAGGLASLRFSQSWLQRVRSYGQPVLIAVQDGIDGYDVGSMLDERTGIFVGGTTAWKLRSLAKWGQVAQDRNCHLHVGRVNSMKRIAFCAGVGAHSFDGTSVTRFAVNAQHLTHATHQSPLHLDFENITIADRCPECGSQELRRDSSGDVDCVNCGGEINAGN
jgi:hypothetical protein